LQGRVCNFPGRAFCGLYARRRIFKGFRADFRNLLCYGLLHVRNGL
jgi:hypothetical protein